MGLAFVMVLSEAFIKYVIGSEADRQRGAIDISLTGTKKKKCKGMSAIIWPIILGMPSEDHYFITITNPSRIPTHQI